MKNCILIALLVVTFISCDNSDNRKIVNDSETVTELKKDSSAIEIADLPIQLDSTNYLIHPIGHYKVYKSRIGSFSSSDSYGKSGYEGNDFTISSNGNNHIAGDLSNIAFQHLDSLESKLLTNTIISINSMIFLKDYYKASGKQIILYELYDKDTNKDQKLDYDDVTTLYISNVDGSSFTKLTPNLQELINWKIITANNTLYFRSIEDTNENGEFDKNDKMHYFRLNLNQPDFKALEYFPLIAN